MATTNNIFYLGQDGAEQLVANVKNLIGDYALKDETEAALGETVKFTAQSLTDEQKAQARENIGVSDEPGVSSWNDLTDKPFYVQSSDTVLLDGEFTTEYIDTYGVFGIDTAYIETQEAAPEMVTLVYDGVEYKGLTFTDIPDLGKVGGNLYHMNALFGTSFEDTGEPFILAVTKTGCAIMTLDTEATAHIIRLFIAGESIEKINPSCLPEGYPYVDTAMVNVIFNGDMTGWETVDMGEGTYLIKASSQYVPVTSLVGSTVVCNFKGVQTVTITEEDISNMTEELGVDSWQIFKTIEVDSSTVTMPIACGLSDNATSNGITLSAGVWFFYGNEGYAYTKSLSCLNGEQEVVHKLDMKYLPDGYPYVETTMVYHPFDGDITGKEAILFQEGAYAVRVSTEYVEVSEASGGSVVLHVDGQEVEVRLDGSDALDPEDAMETLGVPGMLIQMGDGTPIVLSLPTDTEIMGITLAQGTWFMGMPGQLYVKSLSCLPEGNSEVEVVHKIDPKYLPDNIGGAWTCVEIPSRGNVIFEDYSYTPLVTSSLTTPEAPATMWTTSDASAPAFPGLEIGKTYVVNWCGADYVTTCVTGVTSWGPCAAIGSKTLTEEMPFYIVWQDFEGEKLTTVIGLNFANFDDHNYTVGIYDVGEETTFNRLPDACLPVTAVRKVEAQNALNAFYEAHRTHWTDEDGTVHQLDKKYIPATWLANLKQGDVVLTPEATVTSTPTSGVRITDKCNLNAFQYDPAKPYVTIGTPAVVTYDGTVYNLTLKRNVNIQSYIGNLSLYNSTKENTGEPFCLFIKHKSGTKLIEYVNLYTNDTENTEHTISVTVTTFVPETMPEEYLPESVAIGDKMNAKNPIGTGSFSMNRKAGTAVGHYSHAEGSETTASGEGSHAEGYGTNASGSYSHAEGMATKSSGMYSHVEGDNSTASARASHAEGCSTASGDYSHAEGNSTASGTYSHTEGRGTRTSGEASHVQGRYNIEDTENKYAHIVGNGGDYNARSNAHTLDWEGNAWYQGDVYIGSTSGTNRDEGSKKLATEEYVDNAVAGVTGGSGGSGGGVSSWNDLTDRPFGTEIVMVDPVFDGDLTGRETVFVQEGTYAVKVSPNPVSVSDMIGATATVNMGGVEQTVPLTAENAVDASSVLGVPGAVVLQGTDPIAISLPEDAVIQGMSLSAGTWFMCVPGAFYVKSLSCLAPYEGEKVNKLPTKYLPDDYPSVETFTVDPVFYGDTTGFETVLFNDNVYFVKVTPEVYSVSDFVGATVTTVNNGVEETISVGDTDVIDAASMGYMPAVIVMVKNEPDVISFFYDYLWEGKPFSKGTWFVYMPDKGHTKSVSCVASFVREKIKELDKKFLPADAWEKIAAPYVLDLTGMGVIGQNNAAYYTNLNENQYNAVLLAAKRGLLRVKANLVVKSNKNFYQPSAPVDPYDESRYGITITPSIWIADDGLIDMTAVIRHSVLHIGIQTPDQSSNCKAILKEISYVHETDAV